MTCEKSLPIAYKRTNVHKQIHTQTIVEKLSKTAVIDWLDTTMIKYANYLGEYTQKIFIILVKLKKNNRKCLKTAM